MTQSKTDKRHILKKSVDPIGDGEPFTHWRSIYIATILSFIGSVQFSLYFSSLWPYIQILDHGTTEQFFGTTVALYSLGQIISSPLFGLWSNKIKKVKHPLCVGLCFMFLGNLIYILMETIHVFPKRYILMLCRFIIGVGSGNVAILRTYASTASTMTDRTRAISFVTMGQALGLVIGPVFQLVFTPLEHPGYRLFGTLSFSLYTAPAYLALIMNFSGFIMLIFFFKENYAGIIEEPEKDDDQSSTTSSSSPIVPKYDRLATFICYMTRFTDMFVRTNLEVLGSPLAMMFFALSESSAVGVLSMTQGLVGALTFCVYLAYIFFKLERFIQLRNGCIISLIALIFFHLITYSWPFLPHNVELTSQLNLTDDAIGCNAERFEWCNDLTSVNIWVFYGSYALIIGLSFPLLTITMNTLFSGILGPRRQGSQQGVLQVSSGLARMIGPLSASALYSGYGPRPVWMLEVAVICITLSSWLIFYKRMIPLQLPEPKPISTIKVIDPKNKVHPV